jgi:phosphoglucosamine mutase
LVDGDTLLFIIARSLKLRGKGSDAIVGTHMSNLGLEQALNQHDMILHRSKVGDRYVIEKMKETGGSVGGESSGHIICLDKTTTGDGIIAALQVLCEIRRTGNSLHELQSLVTKYPQTLVNVRVKGMIDLTQDEAILSVVRSVETRLGSDGRVLLRPSGTEPVIRVMVEGRDSVLTQSYANEIASVIEASVALSQ